MPLARLVGMRSIFVLVVLAVGCSPSVPDGATQSRLRACGFYTDGVLRDIPLYVPDGCYDACLSGASCEELAAAICGESIELLQRCDARCAYACPGGALIRPDQECDGIENCEGGADEASCGEPAEPDTACRAAIRCDGVVGCADGSDEAGCSGFECATLGRFDDGWGSVGEIRCDGYRQCRDGSDEVGCAERVLTCER